MSQIPQTRDLVRAVLDGEAEGRVREELAARLAADPAGVPALREDLEFAELLRQAFREDDRRAGAIWESARESAALGSAELLERVCEGSATRYECDRIAKELWEIPGSSADLRHRLVEEELFSQALAGRKCEVAFVEALETRMWAETSEDHFVEDFAERLEREIGGDDAGKVVPFPGASLPALLRVAAVAAAVAVGAFLSTRWMAEALPEPAAVASVVKATPDAAWEGEAAPDARGALRSGRYHLLSGVVSLRLSNGGDVTIEGPALFEFGDDGAALVHQGVALARTPPRTHETHDTGISLRSRGLQITDPGVLVGIHARPDDSTEAVVFRGEGGVCLTGSTVCRDIYSFEAVRADPLRDRLVDIPYQPRPYARAWELIAGVEKNLGSVRIELPGSQAGTAGAEGEVQVFVENDSFRTEEALEVDEVRTGEMAAANPNPGQRLQADGDLRSYLLQLWPSASLAEDGVEASLTFDHPVVGVIFSSERLAKSDLPVGSSRSSGSAAFNRARGLDGGGNFILLSDDRRTLNLKLSGSAAEVDQVRVLVALN